MVNEWIIDKLKLIIEHMSRATIAKFLKDVPSSISLNLKTKEQYKRICKYVFSTTYHLLFDKIALIRIMI